MRFTPGCNVVYHGATHRAGIPFEIDPADADELRLLGSIQKAERSAESGEEAPEKAAPTEEDGGEKKAAPRGRQKKQATGNRQ